LRTRSRTVRVSAVGGVEAAYHQAMHHPHAALDVALAREFDAVPCPACGWYQSYMVPRARAKRYGAVSRRAVVFLLAGCVASFVAASLTGAVGGLPCALAWALAVCGLVVGAAPLVRHWRSRRRYDPNGEPTAVRQELGRLMTLTGERLDQAREELRRRDTLRQWGR
jgi:hypothetical protein